MNTLFCARRMPVSQATFWGTSTSACPGAANVSTGYTPLVRDRVLTSVRRAVDHRDGHRRVSLVHNERLEALGAHERKVRHRLLPLLGLLLLELLLVLALDGITRVLPARGAVALWL